MDEQDFLHLGNEGGRKDREVDLGNTSSKMDSNAALQVNKRNQLLPLLFC
jgi:hypothetical protein